MIYLGALKSSKIRTNIHFSPSKTSVIPLRINQPSLEYNKNNFPRDISLQKSHQKMPLSRILQPSRTLLTPRLSRSTRNLSSQKSYQTYQPNVKVKAKTPTPLLPHKTYYGTCKTMDHSQSPVLLQNSKVKYLQYLGEGSESNVWYCDAIHRISYCRA